MKQKPSAQPAARVSGGKPSSAATPAVGTSRALLWLAAGVIVLAGWAAYQNSFAGALVLDDHLSITDNASLRQLWPPWPALSPPRDAGVGGRPLVNLTFAFNYALGGLTVWSYHALNLAIHLLAACILFGLVRRTLVQPGLRERFGAMALPLALTIAVLWAVHPLQTQVVNYSSQRTEALMGLCYLATLYCFIRGAQTAHRRWFVLSITTCLCGALSKEVIVTAPLLLLLYDRTFVAGTFREAWRQRRGFYLTLAAATWLMLGVLMFGAGRRGVGYGLGVDAIDYALTSCKVVVLYLRLALWPHPLVFDYGDELVPHAVEVVPYALILGALLVGTFVALRRRPALGFAGCWFFVLLAPTSSVVPLIGQPMAESRMYLPLAGVIALAVLGLYRIAGRRSLLVWLVLAVVSVVLTLQRNPVYRSEETLCRDTVAKRPHNARAYSSLGTVLITQGQVPEAVECFEAALKIAPDFKVAHYNLGTLCLNQGRFSDAIRHLEQAVRSDPDYTKAHYNLALALQEAHRPAEAIGHFQETLRLDPLWAEAHGSLGRVFCQSGRYAEGVQHLEAAVRLKPDSPEIHNNLGNAQLANGNVAQAIHHYEEAIRLRPDFPAARKNLERARTIQAKTQQQKGGEPFRPTPN